MSPDAARPRRRRAARAIEDALFHRLLWLLSALTVLTLAFVLIFIIREALPVLSQVDLGEFLLGRRWMPLGRAPAYGIGAYIAGTLCVSGLAVALAVVVGAGAAVFLSCAATARVRELLSPLIELLAGIPSVIYGFIGLCVLVRLFQRLGLSLSGHCVLAAAIVLAIMLLPYLISSLSETMLSVRLRYLPAASALGVCRWYAVAHVVLPLSVQGMLLGVVLAVGRAMGETMAVMMVMGNAGVFPTLLGKGETISALIALEMGTAAAGSAHYRALYAAGLALMVILLAINTALALLRHRLRRLEG